MNLEKEKSLKHLHSIYHAETRFSHRIELSEVAELANILSFQSFFFALVMKEKSRVDKALRTRSVLFIMPIE